MLFLLAYHSAVNFRLPCVLLFGRLPHTPSSTKEYLRGLRAYFKDVHHFAQERINMATERMKMRYNIKVMRHEFHKGRKYVAAELGSM